ncbi:hypothetical protein ACFZC3_18795 [Streptomyces sp. NPDC007903]|uniref:hypothetical protein n=1 Tax=Streptomyces sp. NPDC007903 TaxID=3364786 RepID=UPI0036E8AA4B
MKRVGIYASLSFAAAMALTGATAGQASAENRIDPGSSAGVTIVFNNGYYGNIFNTQSGTKNTQGGVQSGTNNTQGGTQSGTKNTQGGTQGGTNNTQGGTQSGTDNIQGGTQSGTDNTQGAITRGAEEATKRITTRTLTLISAGLID